MIYTQFHALSLVCSEIISTRSTPPRPTPGIARAQHVTFLPAGKRAKCNRSPLVTLFSISRRITRTHTNSVERTINDVRDGVALSHREKRGSRRIGDSWIWDTFGEIFNISSQAKRNAMQLGAHAQKVYQRSIPSL